jgi:GNAT superfamily N-acetyltransferase
METALTIRSARPDDRPAMERVCAHTWEWGDYIPEVWDDWLADEEGLLIVGELAGRVVALSRIAFQASGQIWLEGMRVDPEYRRLGVAGQFLDRSIVLAAERGARVVRLGTSHRNTPVHIMTERAGMACVGSYQLLVADPLPGGPELAFLPAERASDARDFLNNSAVMAHTHDLYSVHWAWQELSAALADQYLHAGQVAARLGSDGRLAALAFLDPDPEDSELWISFIDGETTALVELATALRGHAARTGFEDVRVMVPDLDWLRVVLVKAGYGPGDWEGELWIFERWLSEDAAEPAAELAAGAGTSDPSATGGDRDH